jgi:hypothetical protein
VPPAHVPGVFETSSVLAFAHVEAGGVLQLTPAQGSPVQEPAEQPLAQACVVEPYAQTPWSHVPTAA